MKRVAPPIDPEARSRALCEIEPVVESLLEDHLRKRRLWFPGELLGEEPAGELAKRAAGLSDSVRVSLALNLLTEEGLPHFHRLLSTAFGNESPWVRWNFLWTAEEDRHGAVLRDYARDARFFDVTALDRIQYAYQEAGFSPAWARDPYKVLVYVTLQERATWFAHRNTGRLAAAEPVLSRILSRIAAEEARHHVFYREVFAALLDVDPDGALEAAAFILPAIEMPGIAIPGFREMSEVAFRAGVYGPRDYMAIVEEVIAAWDVAGRDGLGPRGRAAQEKILSLPHRLARVADRAERRPGGGAHHFGFLETREVRSS